MLLNSHTKMAINYFDAASDLTEHFSEIRIRNVDMDMFKYT